MQLKEFILLYANVNGTTFQIETKRNEWSIFHMGIARLKLLLVNNKSNNYLIKS